MCYLILHRRLDLISINKKTKHKKKKLPNKVFGSKSKTRTEMQIIEPEN